MIRRQSLCALAAVLACVAIAEHAAAQSEDDDVGFGDLDTSAIETTDDEPERASTTYSITVRADSAVWTERLGSAGFAKLRFTSDPRVITRYRDFRFALGIRAEGDAAYVGQANYAPRVRYDTATRDKIGRAHV